MMTKKRIITASYYYLVVPSTTYEALPLPAITVGLGDDLPIYLQIEQYYTYLFIEKSAIYLRTRCGHCEVKY